MIRRPALIGALVTGLLVAAPAADAKVILTTQVFPQERGRTIPRSFLGFSLEWTGVNNLLGADSVGPDTVYRQLLANLAAYGGGTPTLRVGGNSQDTAWWNPLNRTRPFEKGIYVNIRPITLRWLAANSAQTGQRLLLGVNLVQRNPQLARDEVGAFEQFIPRRYIRGFEIGNEPDSFTNTLTYEKRNAAGKVTARRYARKKPYTARQYLREWEQVAHAVLRVDPRAPLAGTGGYGVLIEPQKFIGRERRHLAAYTEHAYPLTGCASKGRQYKRGDRGYPTLARLLGHDGAFTTIAQERRGIQAAHRFHKPYVVDETGSVACTSRPAVSASFGTTLWALDYLFLQAGMGVDGVNFHIASPDKTPLRVYNAGPGRWIGYAQASYWGMLAFARAAGDRGRILLGPTLAARPARGKPVNVRVWAVRAGRRLRLFVINKDLKRGGTVRIKVPGARHTAQVARLAAPSVTAQTGISFGGQTIPSPTSDGALQGEFTQTPLRPRRGVYAVTVPRASAALLTIG